MSLDPLAASRRSRFLRLQRCSQIPAVARPARSSRSQCCSAIEVLAVSAFQAPFLRFDRFAIFDSGGELAIQDLIRRGGKPAVDFGYLYGLLPLLLGRLWYGLAGLTPGAYRVQVLLYMIASAWGLARFAVYRRLGPVGVILIVAAIPDLMLVSYVSLVQVLEQALLINALAEQARGRRATAFALLTACTFVKPSLAFFQGLAVLIAIVAAHRRSDRFAWVRDDQARRHYLGRARSDSHR